jgi:hypothetical protein
MRVTSSSNALPSRLTYRARGPDGWVAVGAVVPDEGAVVATAFELPSEVCGVSPPSCVSMNTRTTRGPTTRPTRLSRFRLRSPFHFRTRARTSWRSRSRCSRRVSPATGVFESDTPGILAESHTVRRETAERSYFGGNVPAKSTPRSTQSDSASSGSSTDPARFPIPDSRKRSERRLGRRATRLHAIEKQRRRVTTRQTPKRLGTGQGAASSHPQHRRVRSTDPRPGRRSPGKPAAIAVRCRHPGHWPGATP